MLRLLLLATLAIAIAAPAAAGAERRKSLEEAVSEARGQGRVLSARTQRNNGRETHNVRILTRDGRVQRLRIDAESGNPLPRGQRPPPPPQPYRR